MLSEAHGISRPNCGVLPPGNIRLSWAWPAGSADFYNFCSSSKLSLCFTVTQTHACLPVRRPKRARRKKNGEKKPEDILATALFLVLQISLMMDLYIHSEHTE